MTNQPEHELKGKAEQVEGKVQEAYGRLTDEERDRTDNRWPASKESAGRLRRDLQRFRFGPSSRHYAAKPQLP